MIAKNPANAGICHQPASLCRRLTWALCFIIGLAAWASAEPGGNAPRTPDEIQKDIFDTRNQMLEIVPSQDILLDDVQREKLAPKVVPLMRKFANLLSELAVAMPEMKAPALNHQEALRGMLSLLGEQQATDELARLSISKDPTQAIDAKSWQIAVRWVKAKKDAATQERLAEELATLARSQPQNPMIADVASFIAGASATPALAEQLEQMVLKDLQSKEAAEIGKQMTASRKLHALLGQPLQLEGTTLDGNRFNSKDWKGKVVLVDFWATWCVPCVEELPKLKKVYADNHAKGLEIVGVSCDNDADKLRAFLAKNPEMAWPQLFDPSRSQMNPLTEQYGVQSLPTMFLIDRKGVVRSIDAREKYQELIPKLLEEKP